MQIYAPGELSRPQLERIMIYGMNKLGKTRTALAMPRNAKWGKVVYIAVEPNAEDLKPVMDTSGVYIVKPNPPMGVAWDPLETFVEIATKDWKALDPEINTLVFDSGTQMARTLLEAYAMNAVMQKGHVSMGKKGTASYHAVPDKADFGGAQAGHEWVRQHLFNQPLHLIMLYGQDWFEPKSGSLDELVGGPATVGFATIRDLPGVFDTVLRAIPGGQSRFALQTEKQGAWPAAIRHSQPGRRFGTNGVYSLQDDPRHFWVDYDAFIAGDLPAPPAGPSVQPPNIVQPSWA